MANVAPFRVLMILPDEESDVPDISGAVRFSQSYYYFLENGAEIVFASRQGGFSALTAHMRKFPDAPSVCRLLADTKARDELADMLALKQIYADDFDTLVLFVGIDECETASIKELVAAFLSAEKAVFSV